MQPPPPRKPKLATRYSNIVEPTSVKQMLKQLVRLSLQETESSGKSGFPSLSPERLDIRAKYLREYQPEGKSPTSVKKKKNQQFPRKTDFEPRFNFYDRILPIFVHCSLSNKCFFRMISLIERTLSNAQIDLLDQYHKRKTESTDSELDEKFFGYWLHTTALPCLFSAIDAEETASQAKEREVISFLATAYSGMTPQAILGVLNLKLTLFVKNDCDVDIPTHYDILCGILVEKVPFKNIWMLREVVEKVLLVNLCHDYSIFEASQDTVCRAALQFCLLGVDEAFDRYLKNDSKLSQKEKARVKGLLKELKKLRKMNSVVDSIIKQFFSNLEWIDESPENWNFKNWKFAEPVAEDSASEAEDAGDEGERR
jgi:hypothetical protein